MLLVAGNVLLAGLCSVVSGIVGGIAHSTMNPLIAGLCFIARLFLGNTARSAGNDCIARVQLACA